MKMSQDGLNKIVGLLKHVLSGDAMSRRMNITNWQYSSSYLYIFLEEAEKNGDAIGYDDFSGELWSRLGKDVDDYPKEASEFTHTWEAWVDLYRYLKKNNKLK